MLLICVPFPKVLHKIPYVVIHSGLDVLGSLPLNDSQDICEIHFCKCGSPLPSVYSPLPSPLLVSLHCNSLLNRTGSTCKGQSAVSSLPSEDI